MWQFLREVVYELRKVVWRSGSSVARLAVATLVALAAVAVALVVLDLTFDPGFRALFG